MIQTIFAKVEILPLPAEEQACFDRERSHGDLSRVIGHMVIEKCVYATEVLKKHSDTTKFPEPTLRWFTGLIEQSVQEGQSQPQPEYVHYRGKRQSGQRATARQGTPRQPGTAQTQQQNFRIRKEYRMLTDLERMLFHRALQMLKADRVSDTCIDFRIDLLSVH